MNSTPRTSDIFPWLGLDTDPYPLGYNEWLSADIAAGLDDLAAGRFVSLEDIRSEFGHP